MKDHRLIARGEEHNRLAETAKRLEADGHSELASDYQARADHAEAVFCHLRDLDRIDGRGFDAESGLRLAEKLVRLGWNPPEFLN